MTTPQVRKRRSIEGMMIVGGLVLAAYAVLMVVLGVATGSDASPLAPIVAVIVGALLVVGGLVVKALKSQSQ